MSLSDVDRIQDGCHACSSLRNDMSIMNSKLDQILQSLETIGTRITVLATKLPETSHALHENEEIEELQSAVPFMEDQYKIETAHIINFIDGKYMYSHVEDRIDDSQNRSRRNTLILQDIPEVSEEENQPCEVILSQVSANTEIKDDHYIEIKQPHRFSGHRQSEHGTDPCKSQSRPIHCKLRSFTDQ